MSPGDFRLPKYHHLLESEARGNSGPEGTRQGTQGTSGYLNINRHLLESEARGNSGPEGTRQGTQGTSG